MNTQRKDRIVFKAVNTFISSLWIFFKVDEEQMHEGINDNQLKRREILAKLRRTSGKPLSYVLSTVPIIVKYMAEKSYSKPTYEEQAIVTALQIYAWHQQGKSTSVNTEENKNIGHSLSILRTETHTSSMDKRFTRFIMEDDFNSMVIQLRQMIRLLKSKSEERVNYSVLAKDLYWFLSGSKENVRLMWARAYYSIKRKEGENTNENKSAGE